MGDQCCGVMLVMDDQRHEVILVMDDQLTIFLYIKKREVFNLKTIPGGARKKGPMANIERSIQRWVD